VIFALFVFQEIKNGQGKMEKLKITGKLIRKISQIKCLKVNVSEKGREKKMAVLKTLFRDQEFILIER